MEGERQNGPAGAKGLPAGSLWGVLEWFVNVGEVLAIIRVEAGVVAFVGLQTTWPEGADAVRACMRACVREAVAAAAAGWLAGPGPHAKGLARSPARKHAVGWRPVVLLRQEGQEG